jgi:vacuolar protein sorting-associated protein VTA1
LIALLGYLEQVKSEIGTTDAIDNDAAGSAYVENFSLRVFSVADNEDRSGRATK